MPRNSRGYRGAIDRDDGLVRSGGSTRMRVRMRRHDTGTAASRGPNARSGCNPEVVIASKKIFERRSPAFTPVWPGVTSWNPESFFPVNELSDSGGA